MFFFGFFLWTTSMISFVSNSFVSLETFSSIITNFYILFYILTLGVTITVLFTLVIMFYWNLFYSKEIRKCCRQFEKMFQILFLTNTIKLRQKTRNEELELFKEYKNLNLSSTGITDINALAGTPIHELYLSGTQVTDISPLARTPI